MRLSTRILILTTIALWGGLMLSIAVHVVVDQLTRDILTIA